MSGITDIQTLLKTMTPEQHTGEYVFCAVATLDGIDMKDVVCFFREAEAVTIIVSKTTADALGLKYDYIAAWITLTVHSSLQAVGLTAAFSLALAKAEVSCNVIAGYYHDHIFVGYADAAKAMDVLRALQE
ncbi:ACT domain-containing protein [Mucilaginibacter psychrotolerans]|uniref:ACT domain-containing protein n=1 Tax=Mucilaginibacter psychrotolerans TaxID=1524096 RepID=A0A4Y8SMM6_9SPHI|nr:ACT domain-containing protein [Mucilaginibacter psychrotolerans]TFF40309.1 ACT domain-containing protein [Mucilaginibacter psychrotolerans]